MGEIKEGYPVEVVSEGIMRRVVKIEGDRALCERFPSGDPQWFPLSDLKPDNSGPMRAFVP